MTLAHSRSAGEVHPLGVSHHPPEQSPTAGDGRDRRQRYASNLEPIGFGTPGGISECQRRRWARGGAPSTAAKQGMRLLVFPRDAFTCQDCGWQPGLRAVDKWDGRYTLIGPEPAPRRGAIGAQYRLLTLGHRIPATEGGRFEEGNLFAQCSRCNYGEGNRIRAAHDRGLTLDGKPWRFAS